MPFILSVPVCARVCLFKFVCVPVHSMYIDFPNLAQNNSIEAKTKTTKEASLLTQVNVCPICLWMPLGYS